MQVYLPLKYTARYLLGSFKPFTLEKNNVVYFVKKWILTFVNACCLSILGGMMKVVYLKQPQFSQNLYTCKKHKYFI